MNGGKWLVALLIASWTLNVALGVALYLRSRYPAGGFWTDGCEAPPLAGPPAGAAGMMDEFMPTVPPGLRDLKPLQTERRRLLIDLTDALAADTLDSNFVMSLSDSLERLTCRLQLRHLQHLISIRDQMPPQMRRQMVPRMMRRFRMEKQPWKMRHRWRKMKMDRPDKDQSNTGETP